MFILTQTYFPTWQNERMQQGIFPCLRASSFILAGRPAGFFAWSGLTTNLPRRIPSNIINSKTANRSFLRVEGRSVPWLCAGKPALGYSIGNLAAAQVGRRYVRSRAPKLPIAMFGDSLVNPG